jgi:hypothetical protein
MRIDYIAGVLATAVLRVAFASPGQAREADDRNEGECRRTVIVDGVADTGFFASDFTLAEIKRLRPVQDFAERPQQFNGEFEVPTLEESSRSPSASPKRRAA